MSIATFTRHELGTQGYILETLLPASVLLSNADFETLWSMHPEHYDTIMMHGKPVPLPRWQQAYGADYHFSGRTSPALPVPPILEGIHRWTLETIDDRLNGLLVNFYSAAEGHYIGKHRDSTKDMIPGCPIVTVSFGATRIFRVRPWKGQGSFDFEVANGSALVLPFEMNLTFTHELLRKASDTGRRISVTFRGFNSTK